MDSTQAALVIQRQWRSYQTNRDRSQAAEKKTQKKQKINSLKVHLLKLSSSYQAILSDKIPKESATEAEREFMRALNSKDSFRLSINIKQIQRAFAANLTEQQVFEGKNHIGENGKSYYKVYKEYGPKVVKWINQVLEIQDLVPENTIGDLQKGDKLCLLATKLFPKIQCQLLSKGDEFGIHKIVFFLELCKSLGIKPSAIFTIRDLLLAEIGDPTYKGSVIVLRTIVAMEKQARHRGWTGPELNLKRIDSPDIRKSGKRESVTFTQLHVEPRATPRSSRSFYLRKLLEFSSHFRVVVDQLNALLSNIIKTRKRLSQRASIVVNNENQKFDKSDIVNFDGENSDLTSVSDVLAQMVTCHSDFVIQFESVISNSPKLVGDLFFEFSQQLHPLYERYAVLALYSHQDLLADAVEASTSKNSVAISAIIDTAYLKLEENVQGLLNPSNLFHIPMLYLSEFTIQIDKLLNRSEDEKPGSVVSKDNKKIIMSMIKILCLVNAINVKLKL